MKPLVTLELYGVARARVGWARAQVRAATLGEALAAVPQLCEGGRLLPHYVASIGGERFTDDPSEPLGEGMAVLILGADAGG
jgi:hypothetical protein